MEKISSQSAYTVVPSQKEQDLALALLVTPGGVTDPRLHGYGADCSVPGKFDLWNPKGNGDSVLQKLTLIKEFKIIFCEDYAWVIQQYQIKWVWENDKIITSEDFNSVLCHAGSSSGWHNHITVNIWCSHFNLNFPFLVRNASYAGTFRLKKLDHFLPEKCGLFCFVLFSFK